MQRTPNNPRPEFVPAAAYQQLEATCRLWMAACAARDERVAELQAEVEHLQQRVARLTRVVGRRPRQPSSESGAHSIGR